MRGRNIGVFAGSDINEHETKFVIDGSPHKMESYAVMGLSRSMCPNRISHFLDFRGVYQPAICRTRLKLKFSFVLFK